MGKKKNNNFKLLSDEPIIQCHQREEQLDFKHAAEVLAKSAIYTESPITIGIYANWGTAKGKIKIASDFEAPLENFEDYT